MGAMILRATANSARAPPSQKRQRRNVGDILCASQLEVSIMKTKGFSRRGFLRSTAMGSTSAALASLPGTNAAAAGTPSAPPWPVTVESFPLAGAGAAASQVPIKLVVAGGG